MYNTYTNIPMCNCIYKDWFNIVHHVLDVTAASWKKNQQKALVLSDRSVYKANVMEGCTVREWHKTRATESFKRCDKYENSTRQS